MSRTSILIVALVWGACSDDGDGSQTLIPLNLTLTAEDSPPYPCWGDLYLQGDNFPEPYMAVEEPALLTVSVLCMNASNGTPSFKFVMSPDDVVTLMTGGDVMDPMPRSSIEYRDDNDASVGQHILSVRRMEGEAFGLTLTLGPNLRDSEDPENEGVSMAVEGKWRLGCSERGEVPTKKERAYATPWCQSMMTTLELWDVVGE